MGTHFQKNNEIAANSKHFPSSFWKKLNVFLCNFFAIKWEFNKMWMFSEFLAILEQNGNPFYQEHTVRYDGAVNTIFKIRIDQVNVQYALDKMGSHFAQK